MTISTIRRVTAADLSNVNAAALRFCSRHGIKAVHESAPPEHSIEAELFHRPDPRLARLWQQCYCRALGEPYDSRLTVAYGYVGLRLD